ncbi:MAG: hypothetical protein K6F14_02610 [Clostridiales bacterium]|nr:hypothetical protein [Clostridiales bacterium]
MFKYIVGLVICLLIIVFCVFCIISYNNGEYNIIPKGEPATEEDIEAFNNTMTKTLDLDNYSSNISVSFKVFSWVTAEIKLESTLNTIEEQTNGSTMLSVMDDSCSCTYEYPVYNKYDVPYAQLMLENGKYIYIPKDFASLGNGVIVDIPDSALTRLQILNSDRTSFVTEITNDEITAMYGDILDFFVNYASDFDIELGTLSFDAAYIQVESNGDYFNGYIVFMKGTSQKGRIEVAVSINITPNE